MPVFPGKSTAESTPLRGGSKIPSQQEKIHFESPGIFDICVFVLNSNSLARTIFQLLSLRKNGK